MFRNLTLTLVLITSTVMAADRPAESLDVVKKNLAEGKAVLVDVREQQEWDAGHLDKAMLVPWSRLQKKTLDAERLKRELPPGKILYTYCKVGARALGGSAVLKKLEFDARPLEAGYEELLRAGIPKAK